MSDVKSIENKDKKKENNKSIILFIWYLSDSDNCICGIKHMFLSFCYKKRR